MRWRAPALAVTTLRRDNGPSAETGIPFGTREISGAVADIGVLLPIAVALIVANGLPRRRCCCRRGSLYVTVAIFHG